MTNRSPSVTGTKPFPALADSRCSCCVARADWCLNPDSSDTGGLVKFWNVANRIMADDAKLMLLSPLPATQVPTTLERQRSPRPPPPPPSPPSPPSLQQVSAPGSTPPPAPSARPPPQHVGLLSVSGGAGVLGHGGGALSRFGTRLPAAAAAAAAPQPSLPFLQQQQQQQQQGGLHLHRHQGDGHHRHEHADSRDPSQQPSAASYASDARDGAPATGVGEATSDRRGASASWWDSQAAWLLLLVPWVVVGLGVSARALLLRVGVDADRLAHEWLGPWRDIYEHSPVAQHVHRARVLGRRAGALARDRLEDVLGAQACERWMGPRSNELSEPHAGGSQRAHARRPCRGPIEPDAPQPPPPPLRQPQQQEGRQAPRGPPRSAQPPCRAQRGAEDGGSKRPPHSHQPRVKQRAAVIAPRVPSAPPGRVIKAARYQVAAQEESDDDGEESDDDGRPT